MRALVVVSLLAGGCNQLLGVDDVHLGDAATLDSAAPDSADTTSCAVDIACPSPVDANRISVCGRLFDVASDGAIAAASPTGQRCGGAGQPDGACALGLSFYDALAFSSDPSNATPEPIDSFTIDDCGRWEAEGVVRPASNILVVGVDDGQGQPDMRRLTGGLLFPPPAGQIADHYRAYSISIATDSAWSLQNGFPAGNSLVDQGAALASFRFANGTPVPGVTILINGTADPTHDYYFGDAGIGRTTTDATLTGTGADGSGLSVPINGIQSVTGSGGTLPSGCSWPMQSGTTVPTTLVVGFFVPLDTNGNPC